jgi:hypothetical protein
LREIEQRARRLRGLYSASIGFSIGCTVSLVVAGFERLGLFHLSFALLSGALAAPPICAGVLLYLFGRNRPIHLPQLLLKVDLALRTEERLSALYELRRRSGGSVFRDRIEEYLEKRSLRFEKGLALRWHRLAPFALGGALLIGVALLVILPSNPPVSLARTPPISVATRGTFHPEQPASEPSSIRPGEVVPPKALPQEAEGTPNQGLEDVLSEIWKTPGSTGTLTDTTDLTNLMEEQRRLSQALSDLLSRIEERLKQVQEGQGEQAGLTEEERQALSELLSQMVNPQIRQTLESLLQERDPETLERSIEHVLNLMQDLAGSSQEPGHMPAPAEEEWPSEEGEEQGFAWEMPDQNQQAPNADQQEQNPSEREEAENASQEDRLRGDNNDPFGGKKQETQEGEGTAPPEKVPTLVRQELAGTIGTSGEFEEFLTKGVPLEPGPSEQGAQTPLVVNYETMRVILEERAIPMDAREAVKKYFKTITQGGS